MKIVIVGSNELHSIESFYIKYFKEAEQEIMFYPAQSLFFHYYNRSLLHKLFFKTGFSGILREINIEFKKKIDFFKPDIVWVFKGMELFPETIQWIGKRQIKVANYNPDNPFLFTGKGSGNKNVTNSIQLYDLHFTYNLEIEAELKSKYGANTSILPFGFDVTEELYHRCAKQNEIPKVCFLGNPDKQRAFFVESLAEKGVELDIYGNNWNQFISHKNINIYEPVYGEEFWHILRKYRIQLNLLRIHNQQSHNMRTFEIPAIGGIQLAPNTSEHTFFFKPDEEIFLYQDTNDCHEKIVRLLSLSDDHIGRVRDQARQRCISSGYSYKDRAKQVLNVMNEMLNG